MRCDALGALCPQSTMFRVSKDHSFEVDAHINDLGIANNCVYKVRVYGDPWER